MAGEFARDVIGGHLPQGRPGRRPCGQGRQAMRRWRRMRRKPAGVPVAAATALGDLFRHRLLVIVADTVRSCRAWWKSLGTYVS
jgi:hypothetical protein